MIFLLLSLIRDLKDGYIKDVYHFEACYYYGSGAYFLSARSKSILFSYSWCKQVHISSCFGQKMPIQGIISEQMATKDPLKDSRNQ